jgi:DNA-binding NarL/FixJ family response regulator
MSGLLLTGDLLISSEVLSAASAHGWPMARVGTVEQLAERARDEPWKLVLVDLSLPGLDVSQVVKIVGRPSGGCAAVVAFGPHVHAARLKAAAAAGCDRVVSRGQLSRRLVEILAEYLQSRPPPPSVPSID